MVSAQLTLGVITAAAIPAPGPGSAGPWFGAQGRGQGGWRWPLTPPGGPAPQAVGVLPATQVGDEGAQSLLVADVLRDHHLLLDDVRLWEVGPPLQRESGPAPGQVRSGQLLSRV